MDIEPTGEAIWLSSIVYYGVALAICWIALGKAKEAADKADRAVSPPNSRDRDFHIGTVGEGPIEDSEAYYHIWTEATRVAVEATRHRDAAWVCFAVVSLAALYLAQYLDGIGPKTW